MKLNVVIVGGGLVGSLEALYLAKRGHRVSIYEYREDIRKTPLVRGRSINMVLSVRGRQALKRVGLEDRLINENGVEMRARMIHRPDGSTYAIPYNDINKQCIYSVGRNYLNSILIEESEKYANIKKYFHHKLIETNCSEGIVTFLKLDINETVKVSADLILIIGADGAYSTVRKEMMKRPHFNFSQEYIEHGCIELCIPAGNDERMAPNNLHIWPRGNFMMVGFPNRDGSWNLTLVMPFKHFDDINTKQKLFDFFTKYFQDSIPLIGEKKLIDDYFSVSPQALIVIKCRPYHVNDKVLIMGDSAHATVPFYGQGMNSGFEDCVVLDRLFLKHNDDVGSILEEFSDTRWRDAFAISDLAMYNYLEMRDLVTRPSYRLRKAIDEFLYWLMPDLWVPLYNSVTFSTIPYHQCVINREWQNRVLTMTMLFLGLFFTYIFYRGYLFL